MALFHLFHGAARGYAVKHHPRGGVPALQEVAIVDRNQRQADIASGIHENSKRRDGPLVKLNCAALAESILESELFGHEKGSFTGAVTRRRGKFELARRGEPRAPASQGVAQEVGGESFEERGVK